MGWREGDGAQSFIISTQAYSLCLQGGVCMCVSILSLPARWCVYVCEHVFSRVEKIKKGPGRIRTGDLLFTRQAL